MTISERQLLSLVEVAAQAAVNRSNLRTLVPVIRHATVVTIDIDTHVHEVRVDGDVSTIWVHDIMQFGPVPGTRVTVLFAPPHQGLIIGVVNTSAGDGEPYGARGQGSAAFVAQAQVSVAVSFGVTFAEDPTILVTPRGTVTAASCVVNADTPTGFSCQVNAGATITGTITFNWAAFGRRISA